MTAQVVPLPVIYQRPPSRWERIQDRLYAARGWVESKTVDRSPVVLVRRSELGRRERNAFDLGRKCERFLSR